MRLLILLVLIQTAVCYPTYDEITPRAGEKCGYESCPKSEPGVLNVHIVPHTHDDVGWLKTVDQYYFGSRNNIQKAGVQYILDSVVKELWEDPERRFIYVETAFFWKWWLLQNEDVKSKVHTLVRQGRLEFIGGAWSMNDEAATHYQSTIDQFTYGLRKLNDTFGECGRPRIGWQIDPFGHAREFASNLAGMKYDGLFLGRIDYQDKSKRLGDKTMEMIWRGDDDLGKSSDIFTGILYNTYSPPRGFCFDVLCDDEPIIDDKQSPIYNADKRVEEFLNVIREREHSYLSHGNVLIVMGDDFHYQDAAMWFVNIDKLILHTNAKAEKEDLKIKLFYSTPSCYLKAVHDANVTFPTKKDDFFPYASDSTAYWTGYFTSRPTTKFFERQGNNYLQGIKQLQVIANLDDKNQQVIDQLSEAMGVMQHHDAITGTEKQHVTHDYERILSKAIDDGLDVARQAFRKMGQTVEKNAPILSYERCQLNQSECYVSETSEKFIVTLYNPLGWAVEHVVKLPIVDAEYKVYAPNGDEISSQISPLPEPILHIPTRVSKATHELVFIAKRVRPLGIKQFFVVKQAHKRIERSERSEPKKLKLDYSVDINDYWKRLKQYNYLTVEKNGPIIENIAFNKYIPIKDVTVENYDGNINNLQDNFDMLRDNQQTDVKKELLELERLIKSDVNKEVVKERISFPVLNEDEIRMLSDEPRIVEAYEDFIENERYRIYADEEGIVIRDGFKDIKTVINVGYYEGCVGNNENPANRSSGAYIFRPNGTKIFKNGISNKKYEGPVFKRFEVIYDFGALQCTLYDIASDYIELSWTLSIDVTDEVGKEFFIHYKFKDLKTKEFYTDSNGRQFLERKLNSRPQYDVKLEEPIPGNYYPITNKISITDKKSYITVFTDRAEGGSSLKEDEMEVMIHRRLLHDDAFGVGEALNETAKEKPLVVTGVHILSIDAFKETGSVKEKKLLLEKHLYPHVFVSDAKGLEVESFLELGNRFWGLQDNLTDGVHLLTLEKWSKDSLLIRFENYFESYMENSTIVLDVSNLFNNIKLKVFRETNLSANRWLDEVETFAWKSDFDGDFVETEKVDDFKITLNPKQIRTFIVTYEYLDV